MSLTNRRFAVLASHIAATGANWSADTLALPEATEDTVPAEQVRRFTAQLRAKLDHIDAQAGIAAPRLDTLALQPFWLVWCDENPHKFYTPFQSEGEATAHAVKLAHASLDKDFYVLRAVGVCTKRTTMYPIGAEPVFPHG